MKQVLKYGAFALIALVAIVSTGCAGNIRPLATVGYKTALTVKAAQDSAKEANASGVLPDAQYKQFLQGAVKVNQAGISYSQALQAYVAFKDADSASSMVAAFGQLVEAVKALPTVNGQSPFDLLLQVFKSGEKALPEGAK